MSLASTSIKRPIFITSLIVVIMTVGVLFFKGLSVELFPEVNIPTVSVTTNYFGAGPAEMETLVTKPIEDEIASISGLKRLTSKNLEGVSQVVAEFYQSVDVKYAEQQVRDKVSVAKAKLPRESKEPVIRKMDPSDQPIMTVSISPAKGQVLSDAELFDLADQVIKPRLEQVNNVGSIEIIGGRKREIHVLLDRAKLKARNISVTQVSSQLAASGENVPTGKVNTGEKETVFRSMGEFRTVPEVATTLVNLYGNESSTRVEELGRVEDTLEDERSRAYVNGEKSLFVDVYRQSGSNTVNVVEGVKKQIAKLQPELSKQKGAPELRVLRDASIQIGDNVEDVYQTIVIGLILTIITVYFFLASGKTTLVTGLSLPISLIGSFILMGSAGFSLNIVSLLALTLAIGLLIDDAIVVIENIYRRMEMGEKPFEAAINGTSEIQLSVVAITLVVIAVFAPVAFMKGLVGQFLKQFGLTIAFSMAISLFVALTIIPMLAAYFTSEGQHSSHPVASNSLWGKTMGRALAAFDRFQTMLENRYEKILRFTVTNPLKVLAITVVVFVASCASLMGVPGTFIPPADNGEITVTLDLPPGTNLDGMEKSGRLVDDVIRAQPETNYTTLTVGGKNGEANKAELYVRLKSGKARQGTTTEGFQVRLRTLLAKYANANPIVKEYDASGGSKTQPLTLNLISTDQKQLEAYTQKFLAKLKEDKRLVDLDTTFRPGKPELQIELNENAARTYGINSRTMGDELRGQVEGFTPAKFRQNGNEYDVRVRLLPEQRNLKTNYASILVPNINRRLIQLSDIAKPIETEGAASIDRQNRGRYIQVSAGIAPGIGLNAVMGDIEKLLNSPGELQLPPGMRYGFQGDSENFQEMADSMVTSLGLAVLLIYLILASLYESFITPITVFLALPLALCGAFVALFVMHESLNLFSILGVFLLLGVSAKNSILLVDFARQRIGDGFTRADALVAAGKARLRPILMTSFALIAGTVPVAIGLNESAKQRTSMGVAIIGGLISCTILTLVVVPAAFSYIDRFRVWFENGFARIVRNKKVATVAVVTHESPAQHVVGDEQGA